MEFKRHALSDVIRALEAQNQVLGRARHLFLLKSAQRGHYEATMIREAEGKSHAEKANNAKTSAEWLEFSIALAKLESGYEFQKLKFQVMEKDWQSRYLSMKLDESLIKKQE